jgi:hypothetical protein
MVFPYLKGFGNNKVWFLLSCFVDLLCISICGDYIGRSIQVLNIEEKNIY